MADATMAAIRESSLLAVARIGLLLQIATYPRTSVVGDGGSPGARR
jgi:hypothetical protein